jgi:hypothetical protein
MKDRKRVHPGKDRCLINIQHLDMTQAAAAPRYSSLPADNHPPVRLDSDFGSGPHAVFSQSRASA